MLHNPFSIAIPKSVVNVSKISQSSASSEPSELFYDSPSHDYRGPTRTVTFPNATSSGGGAMSRSEDGERCAVSGRESLRILRVSEPSDRTSSDHKFAIGKGGYGIEASRNMWTGSGLKVDSAITDVAWCHKLYNSKLLTSARNGELILWDLNKSGPSKIEKRAKEHMRAINKISYCRSIPHYCATGSSDGNLRIWDIRDLSKTSLYVHHTGAIRTVLLSSSILNPFHAITGLDNGSISRWDLRMGQRGQIDRVALAHAGSVLDFDWCNPRGVEGGWLASAGMDRTVKVWDFSDTIDGNSSSSGTNLSHSSRTPAYTLFTSYPVRRVAWRTGYETELAIASNYESGFSLFPSTTNSTSVSVPSYLHMEPSESNITQTSSSFGGDDSATNRLSSSGDGEPSNGNAGSMGDGIEIWDVRRSWIAKWTVSDSNREGGVTSMIFADSHALWVQHPSGAFSQMDLRFCDKPIDSIPRTALTWAPTDTLTFVVDSPSRWEVPYDDAKQQKASLLGGKGSHKKLGDNKSIPITQAIGTAVGTSGLEEVERFYQLAHGYRIHGADKSMLCEMNAEVAFSAGHEDAGVIWLLLQCILMDSTGSSSPALPLTSDTSIPFFSHSGSVQPETPISTNKSPSKLSQPRSSSLDSQMQKGSSDGPDLNRDQPTGKAQSLQLPFTPRQSPSRVGQDRGRRSESPGDRLKTRHQNTASHLRPQRRTSATSLGATGMPVPGRSSRIRQVGEGALDSSGSSEDGVKVASMIEQRGAPVDNSDHTLKFHVDPGSLSPDQFTSNKSPNALSVDSDEWMNDKRNEYLMSLSSSDSESDNSVASTTPALSSSLRHSGKRNSLKSLAASYTADRRSLSNEHSRGSVRTVVMDGTSVSLVSHSDILNMETTLGSDGVVDHSSTSQSQRNHSRLRSSINGRVFPLEDYSDAVDENEMQFSKLDHIAIREAENQYHQATRDEMHEIFDYLVRNGDIQMCAMLSCIAPEELGIRSWQATRFLESYINILSRMRMHVPASYIRKYAQSDEIRKLTKLQTTVNTICSKCGKTILQPIISIRENTQPKARFDFCKECKKPSINCTICRLPVHTALFVCVICSHGGHRDCYDRYYMNRPMVDFPPPRSNSTSNMESASDDEHPGSSSLAHFSSLEDDLSVKMMGYPCAAGCGHFCQATTDKSDSISR